MIKRIELWDFESHAHTVVSDFSNGFNVICGRSDAGKSSIFRALRLAAYNEFDPNSIRIGKKNCIVEVETERGIVRVTRGTENLWEISYPDGRKQTYSRPGKGIVKEASDIIGLKVVNIGGVNIPVNIMDQSEGHFLLEQLGDKDSSGSMRAQIIDEISGLSGIESLIKAVSLDNSRATREFNQLVKDIDETKKTVPDVNQILDEKHFLSCIEGDVANIESLYGEHQRSSDILSNASSISGRISSINSDLSELPDFSPNIPEIESFILQSKSADSLLSLHKSKSASLEGVVSQISKIQDTSSIDMESITNEIGYASRMGLLAENYNAISSSIRNAESEMSAIPEVPEGFDLSSVSSIISESSQSMELHNEYLSIMSKISSIDSYIILVNKQIEDSNREILEILSNVTTCPLTGKPVSDSCMLKGDSNA